MKKVLSLLVVLSMIASALPATISAAHWADADVAYLVENGAIAEDDAMLETLDTPITRSQMVKVIVALLEGDEPIEDKEYFTDITADDTHIAKAAENGIVNGFGDGTFRPNNPITRQDFFTIVGRAYKLEGEATSEFTDANIVADYAKPYVDALQSIGIVNGYGDGTVNPRGNITIAETLAVMHRTDEHVNANTPEETPKEEEKKPTGSSGGGGGGYVGGGGGGSGTRNPTSQEITIDHTIEWAEDFSGEYVAYLVTDIDCHRMLLIKDVSYYLSGFAGDALYEWEIVEEVDQYISKKDGKFGIPDFGKYELHMLDEYLNWAVFKFEIWPPASNDAVAPHLQIDALGESSLPRTFQVTASDDAGIARIGYVKRSHLSCREDDPGEGYNLNVKGRHILSENNFIIEADGQYTVCAMDVNGNCTYININVYQGGNSYIGQSQSSYSPNNTESEDDEGVEAKRLTATFDIELTDDYSSGIVARIIPTITKDPELELGTIWMMRGTKDTYYLPSGGYGGRPSTIMTVLNHEVYVPEKDGVYNVSSFGPYTLIILDKTTGEELKWSEVVVNPKNSDDTTPPTLEVEIPEDISYPLEIKVRATDDVELAKLDYVQVIHDVPLTSYKDKGYIYKMNMLGRKDITDGVITVENSKAIAIRAMDTSGNCAYVTLIYNSADGTMTGEYERESIAELIGNE